MRIIGQKITLDRLEPEYLHMEYIDWINDEEMMRYAGYAKTICHTMETEKEYINRLNEDPDTRLFGIFKEGILFGNIRVDIDFLYRVATISIIIGKPYWSNGYGTEAIKLITEFCFNTLNMHRVEAGVLSGNLGSYHAFLKAGFNEEGRQKDRRYIDGKYVDSIMFGKIKKEG